MQVNYCLYRLFLLRQHAVIATVAAANGDKYFDSLDVIVGRVLLLVLRSFLTDGVCDYCQNCWI
jgi:hypothetical protein